MQFVNEAPRYKIVRTTGPQSNYLGLELSESPVEKPVVVDVRRDQVPAGRASLTSEEVAKQVLLGVVDASQEVGRDHYVKSIEFVSTDSGPHEVYRFLAAEVIRRVCSIRNAAT